MKASLNWLRDFVEINLQPEELAARLTMGGLEVVSLKKMEGDVVFELELTPNRPDCLSIIGIAREVAALTGKKMKSPYVPKPDAALRPSRKLGRGKPSYGVKIGAPNLCLRYTLRHISRIRVGPSPKWLADRLIACGVRGINNVVDITNYVQLEFGTPMHVFDCARIRGRIIEVRRAKDKERLITIDGLEHALSADDLVIADEAGPIALAGVIGGRDTEVSEATVDILLECAYFEPMTIRRTSARFSLSTESSYRFERGVDIAGIQEGSIHAAALILDIAGGEEKMQALDKGRYKVRGAQAGGKEKVITLRASHASRILGVNLSVSQIRGLLNRLTFKNLQKTRDEILVTVPSFRRDIEREIDLIEEAARVYGYDRIPCVCKSQVKLSPKPIKSKTALATDRARESLVSLGFNEVLSYSLVSRQDAGRVAAGRITQDSSDILAIKNPLALSAAVLRRSLLSGIIRALAYNTNRGCERVRIFELGAIYMAQQKRPQYPEVGPKEGFSLGIGIAGARYNDWQRGFVESDFFDLKGAAEVFLERMGVEAFRFERDKPDLQGRAAGGAILFVNDKEMGSLFEVPLDIRESFALNRRAFVAEIDFEGLFDAMNLEGRYLPVSKFPSIFRDMAIVANEDVTHEQLHKFLKSLGEGMIRRVELFDQYIGPQIAEGRRSLAYRIEYAHPERTLTDEEVGAVQNKIIAGLEAELGASLR